MALLAWIVGTFVAAAVGGIGSRTAPAFHPTLDRPAWAPPGWLFGPAWTVLYLLMAIAGWLVWRERGAGAAIGGALALYVAQLVLNALWSWIFFAWRRGGWAFVGAAALWLAVLATLLAFWRVRPLAGALLVPYLAWVAYATALTWAVWRANPGRL
jgi:tryptophan-rich sensory protein